MIWSVLLHVSCPINAPTTPAISAKRWLDTTEWPTGVGPSLQRRGPCSPPHAKQQGPPQALLTLGRAVRRRGSTPTRRLQVENHRRQDLHQRLEHRTATSFLPLNKHTFPYQFFVFTNPRALVTSDPRKLQGVKPRSGAGTNDISMFTSRTSHVSNFL